MTIKILTIATAVALTASASALAQQGSPACQRLEAQLNSIDRGNDDPGRAEQIRRAEQSVNQQQFEVDRLVAASRRQGCESSGFFSIFNNPPAQCSGLTRQIEQQRTALERTQNDLERLNGGTTERAAQRRSLLISLADQGCGPQYRNAAIAGQQGGFFDKLFGNNPFSGDQQNGTFRTICVRSCDGFYYPISFATSQVQFRADEQTCQRMCPASEVSLYTYRNPGEEVQQAVALNSGRAYTELPAAFQYRQKYNPECSCRKPGQSWADALKTINDNTVEQGDIVVNEQRARQLSRPTVGPDGKPIRGAPLTTNSVPANGQTPAEPAEANRTVRSVGPQLYPVR